VSSDVNEATPEVVVPAEPNPSRLDVWMGVLSVLLVGGFFVDLWAHSHGRVDDSFFTPWHGLLYAAAGLFGGVLYGLALRARRNGAQYSNSLPPGYGLSLIGAGLFLVSGLADLVWHELFGIEADIDALLSPTHLALATSGIMMVFGPVRSAWHKGPPVTFPAWLPWVASMTMGLAILGAFTEYAHTGIDTWPEDVSGLDASRSDLLIVSVENGSQTRIPIDGTDQVWMPDFAPDGRLVISLVSDDVGRLVVMNADGTEQTSLYEGEAIFHHAEWSPDGSLIAFTEEVDGNAEVFVVPAEGGSAVQLTDNESVDWGPSWSPDGTEIVFTSDRDGDPDLYLMPSTGGEPVQLTNAQGTEAGAAWSPDGEWIAFDTDQAGNQDIALIRPDGSGLVALTPDDSYDLAPAWSPDGAQIAFASDRTGETDLYVMEADGSGAHDLTNNPGGHEAWAGSSWSADSLTIATNQSGHTPFWMEPFVRQALGASALLIQAALISGFVLLILRHGRIPFGALTVLVGVSGAMMTVISDNQWYIAVALVAGFAGDLIAASAKPSTEKPLTIRIVAFLVPAVWYALYLLALVIWGEGIGWSLHMAVGAPFLAGAVGLLLSFLAFPGTTELSASST
jgi:Tol biopolymer transport system component